MSKSWIGTLVDSDSSLALDELKRKVSFGSIEKNNVKSESFVQRRKQGEDSLTDCSTSTLSTGRKSISADDLSSQLSDGSVLLVEWGECDKSYDGETNHEYQDLNPAVSGLALNNV